MRTPAPAPADPGRAPRRRTRRALVVTGVAVGLFAGGALGLGALTGPDDVDGATSTASGTESTLTNLAAGASFATTGTDALSAGIARLQRRLAEGPGRAADWAALGSAYVQQARVTVDPSYYPKAAGALRTSLDLQPEDNLAALTAMGALANARHDFAAAVNWAKRARAVSAENPQVYGVLADAYTQLGKPAQATAAVQRMLDLGPGLASFSRASYDLEQRGDVPRARVLLTQALTDAYIPSDIAFCRYYLGELALNSGNLTGAAAHYQRGLVADPQNPQLRHGLAKVAALGGNTEIALREYANLVTRVPNPQYVVEYGELLTKAGRLAEAKNQFALVETLQGLFAANGGRDDLALAEYEADHGSPARAVEHARAEWSKRQSAVAADALGWALHKAGRDTEALTYANRALARGWRNALFAHHRSEIHRALGNRASARLDALLVREYNPRFDAKLPALGRAL